MIPNLFNKEESEAMLKRIDALQPNQPALWGKMNVEQMMAHLNITFKYTFGQEPKNKPSALQKFVLKLFLKPILMSEKEYKRDMRTAAALQVTNDKDFDREKAQLIENIQNMLRKGVDYFEGKDNVSFGKLSAKEWNTIYAKHINHHLKQFGV